MNWQRGSYRGLLSEVVLPRWVMMSLASATGSIVKGAVCWWVTGVLNRSAACRTRRGKDVSC